MEMRYPTILHLCFAIWATWQMREGTWHKCKVAGRLTNDDRALLPRYSRAWGTLRAVYSPSGTLAGQELPPPCRRCVPQGFAPSFFGEVDCAVLLCRKTSQGTPYMILFEEETRATKSAGPDTARKKSRGKYGWVHNFDFCQVNYTKLLEMAFFPLAIRFESWQTTTNGK